MRPSVLARALVVLAAVHSLAQREATPPPAPAEAYAVYSALMDSHTVAGRTYTWMIADRTTSYAGTTCDPPADRSSVSSLLGHPALDIHPPGAAQVRFQELLAAFLQHCHDTFTLTAGSFHTHDTVRVLDKAKTRAYEHDLAPEDPKRLRRWPADASGLQSFSPVFFNHDHTLAMVHSSFYCGILCATWRWQVLEKQADGWKVLD